MFLPVHPHPALSPHWVLKRYRGSSRSREGRKKMVSETVTKKGFYHPVLHPSRKTPKKSVVVFEAWWLQTSVFTGVGFATEFLFAEVLSSSILSCMAFALFLCIRLLFKIAAKSSDPAPCVNWCLSTDSSGIYSAFLPHSLRSIRVSSKQWLTFELGKDWNFQARNRKLRHRMYPCR